VIAGPVANRGQSTIWSETMKALSLAALLTAIPLSSLADGSVTVKMNFVDGSGIGASAGTVTLTASRYGVVFTPELAGLPAGLHGFHVHENPSCLPGEKDGRKVPALAAGGHYDPQTTGTHGIPWGDGHLGDLPALYVNGDGVANQPVLAPRLKLGDLAGHSLMVHAGGDNHADHPATLGGGGIRMVCGVIP
jgi:Cu-Zn family superoxide dismutase